jgi:hypothetical protein
MISIWPFGSGSGRVKDVKAPQMAQAAMSALKTSGRSPFALRLLYRTLEVDPFHPDALLVLSGLYRGMTGGKRPTGDEIYSAIIIEYAADRKNVLSVEQKRSFDKARLEIMKEWGFVKPRGNETDVDHLGYMTYINELMTQVKSVPNGFMLALVKLGVQAGALDPTKGVPTRAYQEWLRADASTLHL